MKVEFDVNFPDRKKLWQRVQCAFGFHDTLPLKGRESDGVRSRQTIRSYCIHCQTTSLTQVGEWFTPAPERTLGKVRARV